MPVIQYEIGRKETKPEDVLEDDKYELENGNRIPYWGYITVNKCA